MEIKKVLTIAGSDPSGGAGIQSDLKIFNKLNVYGTAIIAALTIQDTTGVKEILQIDTGFIERSLLTLCEDICFDAIKIGMIVSVKNIEIISQIIEKYKINKVIIDPIIFSSNNIQFLDDLSIEALKSLLLPLSLIITPNIREAEILSGLKVNDQNDMCRAAEIIYKYGPKNVLVKGGHLEGEPIDILFDGREHKIMQDKRITNKSPHGTGCVFSAALTAYISMGFSIGKAVILTKQFITEAITKSIKIGKGREVIYF